MRPCRRSIVRSGSLDGLADGGALTYSIVPPVILGRMKLPLAKRLQDKVLHTDAMMQKAD
jgi:hypothetical protein